MNNSGGLGLYEVNEASAGAEDSVRILLVEDSEDDALLIRRLLTKAKFSSECVHWVQTIAEAIACLAETDYAAVLLDLTLPDGAGPDTVRQLVAAAPSVAILVLTGHRDEEVARESLRLGVEDYLIKGETSDEFFLRRAIQFSIERKQTRERLARLEERLLRAQRLESLEVLAGGVAHDFNNLLVGILGNASVALEELPASSVPRGLVGEIERAALAASDLTRQLLAYAGKGRFVVEVLDVSDLLSGVQALMVASVPRNVSLNVTLSDEPVFVRADPTQLRQILMNLTSNAGEALEGQQGDVSISVRTTAVDESFSARLEYGQALSPGQYASIRVQDSGVGMDQATRSRIFDPFFTTKFTGRGLGLAAVLGIVRSHRGAVHVSSRPGHGSLIEVFLPIAIGSEAKTPESARETLRQSKGRILVADDNEIARSVAGRVLASAGYDVLMAEDGEEAVNLFREHQNVIHAVLLDVTMPKVSGDEAFALIRRLAPRVPILVMSGYDQKHVADQITDHARAGFLQKPYRPVELLQTLNTLLGRETRGEEKTADSG